MAAALIDGAALARRLNDELRAKVEALAASGIVPRLAVILVGDDPASRTYVRSKSKAARSVGIESVEHRLHATVGEAELLMLVEQLNSDPDTDGILVQLPLPKHIDVTKVLKAVNPAKDVDGFHPTNVGERVTGAGGIIPCTPMGAMFLIETVRSNIEGLDAVVIGMSNIVGKPMADLLLAAGCTVTVAHIKTVGLPAICKRADIVVVAVGKPGLVRAEWIKPGAIVIDVGINRIVTSDGQKRLVGDVAFDEAASIAGAITPVPGGVGPMTIACLLLNTFQAAQGRRGTELRAS